MWVALCFFLAFIFYCFKKKKKIHRRWCMDEFVLSSETWKTFLWFVLIVFMIYRNRHLKYENGNKSRDDPRLYLFFPLHFVITDDWECQKNHLEFWFGRGEEIIIFCLEWCLTLGWSFSVCLQKVPAMMGREINMSLRSHVEVGKANFHSFEKKSFSALLNRAKTKSCGWSRAKRLMSEKSINLTWILIMIFPKSSTEYERQHPLAPSFFSNRKFSTTKTILPLNETKHFKLNNPSL